MWMPQLEINNEQILSSILKSTIGVISRRTTDAYATVAVGNAVRDLRLKYASFNFVEVKYAGLIQHKDFINPVEIDPEINNAKIEEIANATNELIKTISNAIGKEAGYFFIREIKENLPHQYNAILRELGINLETLQIDYIINRRNSFKITIKNSDVLRYILKIMFEILEQEESRNYAYETIVELTTRLNTKYRILHYVQINNISIMKDSDLINIKNEVDAIDPLKVGYTIQKIVQEINRDLSQKGCFSFINKIKDRLNNDYIHKFEEMGVNFDVVSLNQVLVVKHVFNALIEVLSESSSTDYAKLIVASQINKYKKIFDFLKLIDITSEKSSENFDSIKVSLKIDSKSPSDIGRGVQRILQNIVTELGEVAGEHFIDRFKSCLGKAYVLRIEEMGVNLHIIDLRQNLNW